MPTQRALAKAIDEGLDLVEIAPTAQPPVCKILNFGKYRYEEQQKTKDAKKKQKAVIWKEIRMAPKIDDHDIETKFKAAVRFLDEGDKLKVTVRFRGRENAHPERGRTLLLSIAERLKDHGVIERLPLLEGRQMIMIMNPVRQGAQAVRPIAAPATSAAPVAVAPQVSVATGPVATTAAARAGTAAPVSLAASPAGGAVSPRTLSAGPVLAPLNAPAPAAPAAPRPTTPVPSAIAAAKANPAAPAPRPTTPVPSAIAAAKANLAVSASASEPAVAKVKRAAAAATEPAAAKAAPPAEKPSPAVPTAKAAARPLRPA